MPHRASSSLCQEFRRGSGLKGSPVQIRPSRLVNELFRIYLWLAKSQMESQSRCERPPKRHAPDHGPDVLPGHLPIWQSQRRRPVKWSKIASPFPRSRDLVPADEADCSHPRHGLMVVGERVRFGERGREGAQQYVGVEPRRGQPPGRREARRGRRRVSRLWLRRRLHGVRLRGGLFRGRGVRV